MSIHGNLRLAWAIAVLVSAPLAAQSDTDFAKMFEAPTRREAEPPPPGPPDLPAGAEQLAPLTWVERIESPEASRRTVSRTPSRIHIAFDDGREWLFVRNPTDARRAMGYLVEPAAKRISTYGESDLRNALGIRGWADVLSLGFDASALSGLTPAKGERMLGDVRFMRYAGQAGEVWWSAEQSLAAQVDLRDDARRMMVETIRAGVDESLLQLPMTRFPDYEEASYVDWLD